MLACRSGVRTARTPEDGKAEVAIIMLYRAEGSCGACVGRRCCFCLRPSGGRVYVRYFHLMSENRRFPLLIPV